MPASKAFRAAHGWSHDEVVVLHAGNVGYKQGLENVVEAAARWPSGQTSASSSSSSETATNAGFWSAMRPGFDDAAISRVGQRGAVSRGAPVPPTCCW